MTNKTVTKKLIKIRENIKTKLKALKSNKFHAERELEPFKNILTKSVFDSNTIKNEPTVKIENTPVKHLTTPLTIKKQSSFSISPVKRKSISLEPEFLKDETIYETDPQSPHDSYVLDDNISFGNNQTLVDVIPNESLIEYLEQYDELPREYVEGHIRDTENVYDHHYLTHDMYTDKIHFGDSELTFSGPNLIIKGVKHEGTYGLYELVFKNRPNMDLVTDRDRENFRSIIQLTNANKRNFNANEQIQGHRGEKYKNVIKPIVTEIEENELKSQNTHKKNCELYVIKLVKAMDSWITTKNQLSLFTGTIPMN